MGFFQIALDGPAGAGKSTIAKTLAKELNFTFINSGAIFRCICIAVIDSGITITDNKEIANLLPSLSIGQKGDTIYLNNVDVSERSRANEISSIVPIIAKIPEVRTFAVDAQRKIAETDNIVVEGRDTTTVVFPNATMKCWVFADPKIRAERRWIETGKKVSLDVIYHDLVLRDKLDTEREIGAMKKAVGAFELDTSNKSITECIEILRKEFNKISNN